METQEIKPFLEQIQRNFNEFKQENDEKLRQIEKKGVADPLLTEEKICRQSKEWKEKPFLKP